MRQDPFPAFRVPLIACFVGLIACLSTLPVAGQGSSEDYDRWKTYDRRTRDRVFRDAVRPHWFGEKQDQFWYQVRTGKGTHEYVLVDAASGTRKRAMNHDKLAAAIEQEAGLKMRADRLDLKSLAFDEDGSSCRFRAGGQSWSFALPEGPLERVAPAKVATSDEGLPAQEQVRRSVNRSDDQVSIRFDNRLSEPLEYFWVMSDGALRSYGMVAAKTTIGLSTYAGHAWVLKSKGGESVAAFVASRQTDVAVIDVTTPKPRVRPERSRFGRRSGSGQESPDKKWRVVFDQANVVLVNADSLDRVSMTADGEDRDSYGGRVWWAPDSKSFVVMKTRKGTGRTINMIDSSPDDSIHAKLITIPYAKPGDDLNRSRPILFHVDQEGAIPIEDALFPNPFSMNDVRWRDDSTAFSFVYNQRGHQVLRLIEVEAESGRPRVVIDEQSDTFICYSGKKYIERIDATDEVIWMSERDGWNHLYLIDGSSGKVKNAITSGKWVVRGVERLDVEQRRLWLRVSGIDVGQDPYHTHLVRVDFDGQNLTRLTGGDGDHEWENSPDGRYLIDRYSRVDLPPVTTLRDAESGTLLCQLESSDITGLVETGWLAPERFVAKGRDGKTDIHGIIVRPTNFDAKKKYPVLEAIYAGPHSAFVPKRFGRYASLYAMAELGFIVVKIDGMGTSHRSKAFHDVCWRNLGDSGFPDRIAWMKAAAVDRPEMDLTRVGIWGGSAGGQSAMRALLAHGDFYHAAVADCGCHDNRVDKIWWNEQWMGWPIDSHYEEQSNVTQAHKLKGDLMLIWGELDRNVDPASTMQVVDALVRADKDFEQLIMPGVGHGAAGHPYARRRQADFFVRKLWHRAPRSSSKESP